MSPRGRPVSRPPSLSASGPHQRDAAIITPHRLVAQRASAVRERADVHARTSPVRCLRQLSSNGARRIVADTCPAGRLWATPAHVRHGFHRRPVAAAHSPCLSRPPERMWTDGRRLWPPERRTRVHGPTRHDSANPPRRPRATAPPTRTFGPQGPTLGTSSTPTSRTTWSGSSGPTAPPAAGPPISPRSSAATRGPPP